MDRLGGLVVIAPARRAGDPGSNPGPGENFSLKLLILQNVNGYTGRRAYYHECHATRLEKALPAISLWYAQLWQLWRLTKPPTWNAASSDCGMCLRRLGRLLFNPC